MRYLSTLATVARSQSRHLTHFFKYAAVYLQLTVFILGISLVIYGLVLAEERIYFESRETLNPGLAIIGFAIKSTGMIFAGSWILISVMKSISKKN